MSHHGLLAVNWLARPIERDGQRRRAGDGTRTRDSLLGRQDPAESPPASYEPAFLAR